MSDLSVDFDDDGLDDDGLDDDGIRYVRASLSVTLGREIFLEWSVFYRPLDRRAIPEYVPIHQVSSLAGSSPSPKYAARRLRELRSP